MTHTKTHIYFTFLFAVIFSITVFETSAQNNINVQVKVYDLDLNPLPNIALEIDGFASIKSNNSGIAFIHLPDNALPPKNIEVLDQELEVESWNYSKGILEIIIRKKSYRQVNLTIINSDNEAIPGVQIAISPIADKTFVTNDRGKLTIKLPITVLLNQKGLFKLKDYDILQRRINEDDIIIAVIKIIKDDFEVISSLAVDQPKSNTDPLEDLTLENLDSITSITVLYSLMKKVNYLELDTISKNLLDVKFNELMHQNLQASLEERNTLDLISDSSIIDEDIMVVVEKIRFEEQLLNNARQEFQLFTEQIANKLKEGGQNLDLEERKQLIQLVLNLREMLRQNEELFYRNNEFYKDEVEGLLGQLTDIHDLEDLLSKSEKTYSETKTQLIYVFFGFASFIGIIMLMAFLVKTLKNQRIQLTHANKEISRINSNLEDIVAEKTESLELINNELDTFLYRSSHNLKRPLTSIRGLASIAEITLGSEANSLFDKVVQTTTEMEKMLDKLTMINHINQPVNFGAININGIVETLKSQYGQTIEENQISFKTNIQESIQFKSFPLVIEILISNLLENAFFFCRYNVDKKPEVELSFSQDAKKNFRISLNDNGCGIIPEGRKKMWDMFFIGSDLSKGNGLGLYVTKKAVESLHGDIKMDTSVGQYCKFDITFPPLKKSKRNIQSKKSENKV